MRKKNAKRLVAAALAVVMAAGAVALPASAAADQAYMQAFEQAWDGSGDMLQLTQQYPNSPEPFYWYGQSYWIGWRNGEENLDTASAQRAIQYLDQAIVLGLQAEHPFQCKWDGDEGGDYPTEDGYERDYTADAADMKADIYMWMQGQQEQVINSLQQYLDCWDRYTRINLKEADQQVPVNVQRYISWGYTAAEAQQYAQQDLQWDIEYYNEALNEAIPELRTELDSIRQWYASGKSSFTMGLSAGNGNYLQVTGGKGDKALSLNDIGNDGRNYKTKIAASRPIQTVQRNLDAITIFVPKGTQITVTGDGMAWDRKYFNEPGYWTATETPHIVASPVNDYNGNRIYVYVVGV